MRRTSSKNNATSSQEEIRFVKDQQWKPVYYPLALFSAVVLIFSQKILEESNPYFGLLRILAIVLIVLVGLVSLTFQWLHFRPLQQYRLNPSIGRTRGKTAVSLTITLTFNIVTATGAAFALLYLVT